MNDVEVITRFKPVRVRSPAHIRRIRTLPCSIPGCKGQPVDPHHLKCSPEGGGTVVASDIWAVPLGRWCHHDAAATDGVHATGREADWWGKHGLDPIAIAERHAEASRCLGILPRL